MRVIGPVLAAFVALGGAPALALDCAKATAPVERAVCGDPAAEAADEAMSKAYDALMATLAPQHRLALVASQRRWLKERASLCVSEDGKEVDHCLVGKTQARRAFLSGEPQSGPGAPPGFAPLFIQHVGKAGEYDIDVDALKFVDPAHPGEQLFNSKIDALLKDVPPVRAKDIRDGQTYSYWLDVSAPFASPAFVSAHVKLYVFSGGAHGNSTTSNFAIDLATGKELESGAMFRADAKDKFVRSCIDQIARQKQEKMPDAPFAVVSEAEQKKTIEDSVSDLTSWSFSAQKAEITFDPYALGAYVEGSYSCEFPAPFLRPLLKFDYLPPQPGKPSSPSPE